MKRLPRQILVILLACYSVTFADPQDESYEQINWNVTAENLKYFQEHLADCPQNEVRCLWFPQNHIKMGMMMTLDLRNRKVGTLREVYNWATQSSSTRKLSYSQVLRMKDIILGLPESADKVPFGKGVHLAFWRDGKCRIFTYDRCAVPIQVRRIYDIGGGALDCTYAKPIADKAKAEQNGAVLPLSW